MESFQTVFDMYGVFIGCYKEQLYQELLDFLENRESAESCQSGQQETAAASISLCTRRIGKCTKALRKRKTLVAHSSYIAIDVLLHRTLLQCHEDFEDEFAFYDERRAPQRISHDVYTQGHRHLYRKRDQQLLVGK